MLWLPALLNCWLQSAWLTPSSSRVTPRSSPALVHRVGFVRLQLSAAPDNLPSDALILQEVQDDVWLDETYEYSGLRDDPRTPHALRGYLCSFKLPNGIGCHAFKGGGISLARYLSGDWESAKGLDDVQKLRLVEDLLGAVNHLHCRGCAHLDLTTESLVVRRTADGCAWRATRIVG